MYSYTNYNVPVVPLDVSVEKANNRTGNGGNPKTNATENATTNLEKSRIGTNKSPIQGGGDEAYGTKFLILMSFNRLFYIYYIV